MVSQTEHELTGYPSIDKPWLKYYTAEALAKPPVKSTIFERIYENNKSHSDDIAINYFGNKISYGTMFGQIEKCKNAMINYGVKQGDKVALLMTSTPELVYVVLALCRIGATADLISPLFSEKQIIDRVNETDADIMFVLDSLYEKISDATEKMCIKKYVIVEVTNGMSGVTKIMASMKLTKHIVYTSQIIKWKEFMLGQQCGIEDCPYIPDYPCIMVYSSGSTGASKGIVLTNDGINATISHYTDTGFLHERGNTFLQMIPVWFSTGIVLSVLMPLCVGITVILEPIFSGETFANDIRKYKPNMTLTATSLWLYVLEDKKMKKADMSKFLYPITGGEQILPETEKAINEFLKKHGCKAPLIKGYGMCELGSTITTSSPVHSKLGSVGYPIKNVNVSAFSEKYEMVKYYERGEICVSSPAHMKEYFKNTESTDNFFFEDADGNRWGKTGDVGYIDEDGDVYISGRAADIFISIKGNKIYNFDIEAVIRENCNIKDCEVVGFDKGKYEVPVAYLVIDNNYTGSKEELLIKLHEVNKDKMDAEHVPAGYKFVKSFPVKNNGKRDMDAIKKDVDDIIWV